MHTPAPHSGCPRRCCRGLALYRPDPPLPDCDSLSALDGILASRRNAGTGTPASVLPDTHSVPDPSCSPILNGLCPDREHPASYKRTPNIPCNMPVTDSFPTKPHPGAPPNPLPKARHRLAPFETPGNRVPLKTLSLKEGEVRQRRTSHPLFILSYTPFP